MLTKPNATPCSLSFSHQAGGSPRAFQHSLPGWDTPAPWWALKCDEWGLQYCSRPGISPATFETLAESWVKGICSTGVLGAWHRDLGWGQCHWVSAVLLRQLARVTAGWRECIFICNSFLLSRKFYQHSWVIYCSGATDLFSSCFSFFPPGTHAAALARVAPLQSQFEPENTGQQGAAALRFDKLRATIKIFQIWPWLVTEQISIWLVVR